MSGGTHSPKGQGGAGDVQVGTPEASAVGAAPDAAANLNGAVAPGAEGKPAVAGPLTAAEFCRLFYADFLPMSFKDKRKLCFVLFVLVLAHIEVRLKRCLLLAQLFVLRLKLRRPFKRLKDSLFQRFGAVEFRKRFLGGGEPGNHACKGSMAGGVCQRGCAPEPPKSESGAGAQTQEVGV